MKNETKVLSSQINSRYHLQEKLGEGGMGMVYKAYDTRLQRHIAIKILHTSYFSDERILHRFLHEARAASALNHPNICTIYDAEQTQGTPYIIMEFVEGQSLRDALKMRGSLPVEEILHIVQQVCAALHAAHKKDIIHRDIKPDNIMITNDGLVKVMDFGLAKFKYEEPERLQTGSGKKKDDSAAKLWLSSFSGLLGTVAYMSPEQIENKPVDERTDIFSLGTMLYEMLTGSLPFSGRDNLAVMNAILKKKPKPLPKSPVFYNTDLKKTVCKTLAKDRDDRFSNVIDLKEQMDHIAGILAKRPAPEHTRILRPFRRYLQTVLILILILTLASVVFIEKSWRQIPFFSLPPDKVITLVIPEFESASAGEDNQETLLAFTIWEDLLLRLSSIKSVVAIPMGNWSDELQTLQTDTTKKFINPDYILLGDLVQRADQLFLTHKLIRFADGDTVLIRTFNTEVTDIFRWQGDIAEQLLSAMDIELSEQDKKNLLGNETQQFDAHYYYLWGRTYLSQRYETNFVVAINLFEQCLQLDPKYAAAYAGLAEAYLAQFDWYINRNIALLDSARRCIDKAFLFEPNLAEAHAALGDLYRLQGGPERTKAVLEYIEALKQRSNNPDFVFKLLRLHRELGDFHQAIIWGKKYLQLQPLSADAYIEIALLNWFQGDFKQSFNYYEKAIDLQPDSPNSLGQEGYFSLLRGDWENAEKQYRKTLAVDANSRQAISSLGMIAFFKERPIEAISWYQKLVGNTSEGLDMFNLSCIYKILGNLQRASAFLDSALTVSQRSAHNSPFDHLYLSELGVIYAARGQRKSAIEYIDQAKETRDFQANYIRKNRVLLREAMVYSLIGENEKSLAGISLLLSMNLYSPEFLSYSFGLENVRKDSRFNSLLAEYELYKNKKD